MSRAAMLAVAVMLGTATGVLAANDRPVGTNCNLVSPPPSAGEEINHGMVLRIYPRAQDIDRNYTGCQALMAPENGKWAVISLTEVIKGDPVRVWSEYDTDSVRRSCRFKNGKVVQGNPNTCPMPRFLLMKSMAPGCVERVQEAIAKHGPGAPRPVECEYR